MGAGWRKARSSSVRGPPPRLPACLPLLRSAALALGDSPRRLRDLAARRGVFLRFFPTGFLAAPNGGGDGSDSGGRGEAEVGPGRPPAFLGVVWVWIVVR